MVAGNQTSEMNQITRNSEKEYTEWMNKMKGKPVIGWLFPYGERGISLRNFSITMSMLNLLNYKPDQFALDLVNLGSATFE